MPQLTKKEIDLLKDNDIANFAKLDERGFLIAPGEDAPVYKRRLTAMVEQLDELLLEIDEKGSCELCGLSLEKDGRIPPEIMAEAGEITRRFYDFSIDWVPGFFLSQSLGFLWGGCAISFPDDFFSVFLVRKSFADKEKWFIYSRNELLSHELCHVARMPLCDPKFEEHFAYSLSTSAFRRCLGSCFRTKADAFMFLVPIFVLLAAQVVKYHIWYPLPITPFWCLAALFPIYLVISNHLMRKKAFAAAANLVESGIKKAESVIFRCSAKEIADLASFRGKMDKLRTWLKEKSEKELRWKIIEYRFINNNEAGND